VYETHTALPVQPPFSNPRHKILYGSISFRRTSGGAVINRPVPARCCLRPHRTSAYEIGHLYKVKTVTVADKAGFPLDSYIHSAAILVPERKPGFFGKVKEGENFNRMVHAPTIAGCWP